MGINMKCENWHSDPPGGLKHLLNNRTVIQNILSKIFFSAMSLFASFLVLLLILVEAAPPTASSVPTLGKLLLPLLLLSSFLVLLLLIHLSQH